METFKVVTLKGKYFSVLNLSTTQVPELLSSNETVSDLYNKVLYIKRNSDIFSDMSEQSLMASLAEIDLKEIVIVDKKKLSLLIKKANLLSPSKKSYYMEALKDVLSSVKNT